MLTDRGAWIAALAMALVVAIASGPRPAAGPAPVPTPSLGADPIDDPAASPSAAVPAASVAPPAPLPAPTAAPGLRIAIDRLGIDLPLAPGDLSRDTPGAAFAGATPERVALIHPASAPLGSGGNTYVYAHAREGMFLALWGVRPGDSVRIASAGAGIELRYTVTRIVPRVAPNDISWLDPAGPERLTLQTSTGPLPEDPRFVAVAVPDPR